MSDHWEQNERDRHIHPPTQHTSHNTQHTTHNNTQHTTHNNTQHTTTHNNSPIIINAIIAIAIASVFDAILSFSSPTLDDTRSFTLAPLTAVNVWVDGWMEAAAEFVNFRSHARLRKSLRGLGVTGFCIHACSKSCRETGHDHAHRRPEAHKCATSRP